MCDIRLFVPLLNVALSSNPTAEMFGGNKAQKDKVKQFIIFTQASEKVATKFLKNNVSVNDYFQAMGGQSPNTQSSSSAKASLVAALFDKYKDPEEDAILLEGTEALCRDLALDPADVVVLVLAFHLKCENMCEFTRSGWQNGWLALGCDNISSMKAAVETMRQELTILKRQRRYTCSRLVCAKQSTQRG
ncbi:hypothetical protein BASA81_014207 [Batrachochytrium salamandrivorans]|nr:hypothetical protein BASA81_014207 [Batrachochytrium salamandrivorans]